MCGFDGFVPLQFGLNELKLRFRTRLTLHLNEQYLRYVRRGWGGVVWCEVTEIDCNGLVVQLYVYRCFKLAVCPHTITTRLLQLKIR